MTMRICSIIKNKIRINFLIQRVLSFNLPMSYMPFLELIDVGDAIGFNKFVL